MSNQPSKIFIARLLGLDVFDPLGDRLGRLRDVVVLHRQARRGTQQWPLIVGVVVEVLGKRRVFVPMTRVNSIDSTQIIVTGLVNLRRFEQRGAEALVIGEIFDREVVLRDGSGKATIEDCAMEQTKNGDWKLSELFVRRTGTGGGLMRRKGEALVVSWDETLYETTLDPQGAQHFLATHEDTQPADLADALHDLNVKRMLEVAEELQDERLADVLQELPEEDQFQILTGLDITRAADILEEMEPDDAADLLGLFTDAQREALLGRMEKEEADDVRRLLEYEEGTAGSLMTPVPIILPPEATVAEALAQVRQEDISPAVAAAVLVCRPPLETPTGRYIGMVHMQQLLRYPPPEHVGNIIDRSIEPVSDMATLEEVSRVLATYDLTLIPVINEHDRLVGAVTIDDVLDALLPEDWRTNDDGTPVRKVSRSFE